MKGDWVLDARKSCPECSGQGFAMHLKTKKQFKKLLA